VLRAKKISIETPSRCALLRAKTLPAKAFALRAKTPSLKKAPGIAAMFSTKKDKKNHAHYTHNPTANKQRWATAHRWALYNQISSQKQSV
jgi:hypothetical protein